VEMAGTAVEEDEDTSIGGGAVAELTGMFLGPQQARQRQAEHADGADLKHLAARQTYRTVAISRLHSLSFPLEKRSLQRMAGSWLVQPKTLPPCVHGEVARYVPYLPSRAPAPALSDMRYMPET